MLLYRSLGTPSDLLLFATAHPPLCNILVFVRAVDVG